MKKNILHNAEIDQHSKSVQFSNEEDSLKSRHWRGSRCHSWIEIFFSAFTASYFAILLSNSFGNWSILTTIKFLAWSSVLSALPFYRVCKVLDTSTLQRKYLKLWSIRSEPLRAAISSLCLVVPLLFLQSYLGQQNVLVLYFSLAILFRLIDSRSLYDNIALCILYTVHVQSVDTFYQKLWYTTMRLILWSCLFLGVFCGIILRRSTFRIWEHIRLLIILRKKSIEERVFSNFIAAAHFAPDLVAWRDKDTDSPKRLDSSHSGLSHSQHNESVQASNITVSTPYSNSLAKAASEAGILFSFDQKPIISLEKVKLLDGFERKLATVIAFKQVISDDRECCLNDKSRHELHDLLDRISLQHNISCVRKFGDTWVGCIGLQMSWDNSRKDSYHAILMGCEVMLLAKRMQIQLCCAVESGKIDAGFVGCSSYDVFGPEIRWVLNMVEAKKYGHVLVGNSAKNLNTRRASFDTDVFVNIHFGRVVIDTIWKTKQECEKVHSVYQFSELLRDEESLIQQYLGSDRTVKIVPCGSDKEGIPVSLSWQAMQKLLDGNETSKHYSKATTDRQRWDDEIACELFMSVEERFGMSLDDAVLKGLTESDLELLHLEIETSVKSLMKSHFFGSFVRLLLLLSPNKYRVGVNDYISPLSPLELADDSQEFYCPLEALLPCFQRLFGINFCKNETGNAKEDNHSMKSKNREESAKYWIFQDKKKEPNFISNVKRSESGSSWGHSSGSDRISVTLKPGINAGNKIKGQRTVPFTRKSGYSIHPAQYSDFEGGVQSSEEKSELDDSVGLSLHGPKLAASGSTGHGMGGTVGGRSVSNRSGSDRGLTITRSVQNKKTDNLHASREALFSSTLTRNRHPAPTIYPTLIPTPSSPSWTTSISGKPAVPAVGVSIKVMPPGSKKIETETELPRELPERGLAKYTSDCRSINVSAILAFTSFMALGTALLCIVDENFIYSHEIIKPTYIFGFLALNLLVLNIAERKYDHIVCVVLLILRCLLAVCMMPYLVNSKITSQNINDVKYLQGISFFILCLWFPIALRQSFMFNCLELVLHGFGFSYQWMLADGSSAAIFQLKMRTTMFPVLLLFLMLFWAIEYLCTVSYVIENILVPEALSLYQREYVHSREMLQACSPSVPIEKSRDLHCPRRYQSCAILAIHVKAADVLPGLVDVLSVASFLKEIMMLITSCVKESGLLKVTQFSGLFIAACPDVYDGDDTTPINHIVRTIICLRKIQNKLDAFSKRNSVNVSIGAGLTSGPVTMGLLGNKRFCFDVSGAARDLAVSMATNQNDGIFATESFGPYIRDGQLYGDLVLREVIVTSGRKSMKWLQMDGAFNKGMQLDDFEYMCMLGRGGFGSVHLLWENATEKEYAIKAIPRKRGSAIPKMIQREFIILQQIQHANVVSFKCCIINKGMIYLVMSYVRGGNLKQIVERNKPDLKHLTLWFAELVLALNYVHSLGIIHRDVKPANCMIDASGHLKLADFGLSKIVSPTTSSVLDPSGTQGEVDNRNASATVAINLIKSILPLKSNMSEGEVSLPERSVQILLIDFNLMSSSATRLREMYFKVAAVSSAIEAHQTIASADFKAEIILIDLDSVNMLDPTSTMSSGLALLQELALSSKNVPIIGLSSIDDRDLRRRIIHAGAREVLSLPIHKSARETLSKYGRLYHHLNKADMPRNLSLVFPPGFLDADRTDEKGRKDRERDREREREDSGNNIVRKVPSPTNVDEDEDNGGIGNSISKNVAEGEREGEADGKIGRETTNSHILPSSLAGNTSSYSHVTFGTEHMNTPPNTINDPRQNPFRSAAKHVVSEGQQKHSAVGTIHFMAPEVIFEHKYGRSVDWWACGVTFYECTMRQHLFTGVDKETIIQHILSGTIDLEPLSQHSTLLKNLVEGLLVRNPNSRLGTDGAHTIMRQEFFKGIDWTTISVSNPSYKPAQHVNQRHSIKDKMLFYGEVEDNAPEVARRKEAGLGDYYRSREKEGIQGLSGGFMSRSKKRHVKNMAMRQRKEDFQKLTNKRKSWVSGNHLTLGAEGKKSSPYVSANYNNKSSKGRNFLNRSGMMSASLDWSITMLPEGGSSHSDEDKGDIEEEEETEKEGEGEGEGEEESRDSVRKFEVDEEEVDSTKNSVALDNSENVGLSTDSLGEDDLVEEEEEEEEEEEISVINTIGAMGSLVSESGEGIVGNDGVEDKQEDVDEEESTRADQLKKSVESIECKHQVTEETDEETGIIIIEPEKVERKPMDGSVGEENRTENDSERLI